MKTAAGKPDETHRKRPPPIGGILATAILAGGSAVTASNMGFLLNRPLVLAGPGQVGNNWTSIPFNNFYGTVGQLCSQTGLTSTGSPRATVTLLNEGTGIFVTRSCGTSAANAEPLVPGKGASIRQPNVTGAPASLMIAGAHDPALVLTIPDAGPGQIGNFWFSVPYHTTAVSRNDLCLSMRLTSTGLTRATITKLDAATGQFSTFACGTCADCPADLVLGEFVQIREPNGPKSFVPAHF
jgi:hypothetical protein